VSEPPGAERDCLFWIGGTRPSLAYEIEGFAHLPLSSEATFSKRFTIEKKSGGFCVAKLNVVRPITGRSATNKNRECNLAFLQSNKNDEEKKMEKN